MNEDVATPDVSADSSSAPVSPAPSAGTQNTEPIAGTNGTVAPQPTEQSIPYARFREVIQQNQQLRGSVSEMQGRLKQMETLQEKAQTQGGLSQTDQEAYRQAAVALKQIIDADPELKAWREAMQGSKQAMDMQHTVQSMREAQIRSVERQGVNRIHELADEAQLPKDTKSRQVLVALVDSLAAKMPQGRDRFAAGDLTIFDDAFEQAKPLLDLIKREGQTQLIDTKAKTRQLPPGPRGSAAGPPGLPKLDPANPRAYESALHQAATKLLHDKG